MKLYEYKKEQIFSKVYNDERVNTFIGLLVQLYCKLSSYIIAYKSLRFLREDIDNERKNLEEKILYAKKEIESLIAQLNEFFNEGFFQELTKEQADSISDEYQYLVEQISFIAIKVADENYQRFTDLINFYNNKVVPIFEKLNYNIDIYNKRVDEEHWKYKLRSYEEAIDYYKQNLDIMKKNHLSKKPATEWHKIDHIMSFEEFKEQLDKENNK